MSIFDHNDKKRKGDNWRTFKDWVICSFGIFCGAHIFLALLLSFVWLLHIGLEWIARH